LILVDASVWIDFFGNRRTRETAHLDALLAGDEIAVGDLTLTEMLQGIRNQHQFERTLFLLHALPVVEIAGRALAIKAASNYRALRARGITVRGTIDTLIATRCIEDGHALLFSDRDFAPFVEHLGLISAMAD